MQRQQLWRGGRAGGVAPQQAAVLHAAGCTRPRTGAPRCFVTSNRQVIGATMLKALEGAHAAGYIHRDVKPANFVMNPPDAPSPAYGAPPGEGMTTRGAAEAGLLDRAPR